MSTESKERREELQLTTRQSNIRLIVEPWGEIIVMTPLAKYCIVAQGPSSGCLEVEIGTGELTVYGWCGSTAFVLRNGIRVLACSVPVPAIPGQRSPGAPR